MRNDMGSTVVLSCPPSPPAPELPPVCILPGALPSSSRHSGLLECLEKTKTKPILSHYRNIHMLTKCIPQERAQGHLKEMWKRLVLNQDWSSGKCVLLNIWKEENICFPSKVQRHTFSSIFMGKVLWASAFETFNIRDFLEARPKYGTDGSSYTTNISQEEDPSLQGGMGSRMLTCTKWSHIDRCLPF